MSDRLPFFHKRLLLSVKVPLAMQAFDVKDRFEICLCTLHGWL